MPWLYLIFAIWAEVVGTTALKMSDGFTKFWPSVVTTLAYAVAFYLLAQVLKVIPVGIAYAVWSGLGVASVTIIGLVWFGQKIDLYGYIGIGLIVTGVIVLNTLSKSA